MKDKNKKKQKDGECPTPEENLKDFTILVKT